MIDNVTVLHRPKPPDFYAPGGAATHYRPVAKWAVSRSRRDKGAEIYQDLRSHPWMDITQATRPFNLFTQLAFGVDRDMNAAPAISRLRQRPSAVGPIVAGRTLGGDGSPFGGGGVVGTGEVQQNIFFGRDVSNLANRWETQVPHKQEGDDEEEDESAKLEGMAGPAHTATAMSLSRSRSKSRGRSRTITRGPSMWDINKGV
jgi:hypothetical protein